MPINVEDLKTAFRKKLAATGSLDAAFTKAVWLAYKAGLAERGDVAVLVESAQGLLMDVQDLINESEGVAGFHLNGDVAPWDELLSGGRFERLISMDAARAALAAVQKPALAIRGTVTEQVETERETVYLGTPVEDDPRHNCDAMGCGQAHVLARVRKPGHVCQDFTSDGQRATCNHCSRTVTQHTGDGEPVEFCPECGTCPAQQLEGGDK